VSLHSFRAQSLTNFEFLKIRTVWYELLMGEWPFKGQPSEVIIWQVGKGMKQSLINLQASKEIKVYLNLK
jgi:kinase suppressor of Ras 2